MVVESRVAPQDIGHRAVGQPAEVAVDGFDVARYGTIAGVVDYLSADSLLDAEGATAAATGRGETTETDREGSGEAPDTHDDTGVTIDPGSGASRAERADELPTFETPAGDVGDATEREAGRAAADPVDRQAGGGQAFDHGRLQLGRAEPAVIADADRGAAAPDDHGAEGAADGAGIGGGQRPADDAANIVFAEDAGIERMGLGHRLLPLA